MVDTKSPGDKTLSVPTKTLTLKPRVETGTVRQSFSHGRTKQVVVEKRGKRRIPGEAPATETPAAEPTAKAAPAKAPLTRPATPSAPPRAGSGVVLRTLTEDERTARASALADAKMRDVEERRLAEEEAKRRNSIAPRPRLVRCPPRGRPASPPTSPTRTKVRARSVAAPAALSVRRRRQRPPPSPRRKSSADD